MWNGWKCFSLYPWHPFAEKIVWFLCYSVHRLKVNCEWRHFILMHKTHLDSVSRFFFYLFSIGRENDACVRMFDDTLGASSSWIHNKHTPGMKATHANTCGILQPHHIHLNDLFKRDFPLPLAPLSLSLYVFLYVKMNVRVCNIPSHLVCSIFLYYCCCCCYLKRQIIFILL